MAKPRDAAKERYWRRLIRRHVASGLGSRRFCAQEGVPEHQFHWWRRTLRDRDRRAAGGQNGGDASRSTKLRDGEGNEGAFVPVRLPFSLGTPLEVVHPRGYVIRVPAVFDPGVLRRLLGALDTSDAS
jgi:hypothetical protein